MTTTKKTSSKFLSSFVSDHSSNSKAEEEKSIKSFSIIDSLADYVGDITTKADLLIDGKITGNVVADKVTVSESGKLIGKITANIVVINGMVEHSVDCSERLTIKEKGLVKGVIKTKHLVIELGGKVLGEIQEFDQEAQSKTKGFLNIKS